jgi:hypothetical protein
LRADEESMLPGREVRVKALAGEGWTCRAARGCAAL